MAADTEFFANMDAMNAEGDAWQVVVAEWRKLFPQPSGFDFNAPICNPLVKAIELWGENLALLRSMQTEEVVENAMHDKMAAYDAAVAART